MLIYLGVALFVANQSMRNQRSHNYFRHFSEEFKLLVALIVGITWPAMLVLIVVGGLILFVMWAIEKPDDKN